MQHLKDSGAVRPIYGSLGVKRLIALKLKENISFGRKTSRLFMTVVDLGRRERNLSQRVSWMSEKVRLAKGVKMSYKIWDQGRRLRVASGATAPGPALEGAQRFRPMSLSSYILWKCWYMLRLKSFFKVKFRSVVLGCLLYRNRHNQCLR